MKKLFLLTLAFALCFSLTACSDSEYTYTDEEGNLLERNEDGVLVYAEDVPAKSATDTDDKEADDENAIPQAELNDGKYRIGDTINFTSGLSVSIVDCGINYNNDAYISFIFTNNGNDSMDVNSGICDFYVNDFAVDNISTYPYEGFYMTLAPGRKGEGTVYGSIGNYDCSSSIEGQIGDAIIVIQEPDDGFDAHADDFWDFSFMEGHYKSDSNISVWVEVFEYAEPLSVGYLYVLDSSKGSSPVEYEFWNEYRALCAFTDSCGFFGERGEIVYFTPIEEDLVITDSVETPIETLSRVD